MGAQLLDSKAQSDATAILPSQPGGAGGWPHRSAIQGFTLSASCYNS